MNAALRLIPSGAPTAATYYMVPHLTHRTLIYEFPNPWITTNWGIANQDPPDPSKVDWLVVDTSLNGTAAPLFTALTSGEFSVVFDQSGIVVATRVKAGTPNDHNWPGG